MQQSHSELKSKNKRLKMHNVELENDLEGLDRLFEERKLKYKKEVKDLKNEIEGIKNNRNKEFSKLIPKKINFR